MVDKNNLVELVKDFINKKGTDFSDTKLKKLKQQMEKLSILIDEHSFAWELYEEVEEYKDYENHLGRIEISIGDIKKEMYEDWDFRFDRIYFLDNAIILNDKYIADNFFKVLEERL